MYKASLKNIEHENYFIYKGYVFGEEEERMIFFDETEAENMLDELNEQTKLSWVLIDENK